MASATVIITQRNIAEREAQVQHLLGVAQALPKKSAKRRAVKEQITKLLTEIAAFKASLHYYKPTGQLQTDMANQKHQVKGLTAAFQQAQGAQKKAVGQRLRQAAKALNEMTAAAKLQRIHRGLNAPLPEKKIDPTLAEPSIVLLNPTGLEEEAVAVEAAGSGSPPEATDAEVLEEEQSIPAGFVPSDFSVSALSDEALSRLSEAADELDDYVNEEGEVWYKNPIVVMAGGVAAYLILRRS